MDNDDIPPRLTPHETPPVTDQAALQRTWRSLVGELGFGAPQLWLAILEGDGSMTPYLAVIDDLPAVPDPELVGNLMAMCAQLLEAEVPAGSVAFLYARPGRRGRTDADRAWGNGLAAAARAAGLSTWPVHLANDHELTVFAPDEMDLPDSA